MSGDLRVDTEGLHQSFARWAQARPGAVAVVANGAATTYGELDAGADGWAAELARLGVGPGHCVPILLPRGVGLLTALLAVLKTGAAYALLDPTWPASRLQDVIGELEAPLLIGPDGAAVSGGRPVWAPPAARIPAPAGFRPLPVAGSHPCCVFFTSGTTGRPKGVLTPHRATARLFQPDGFARFCAETVMPLASPVAWDAFSLELWAVLLNGGTSLIVDEPYLSPTALRAGVVRHGVDTVWLTSSLFNMIVDEDPDAFRGVAQVMTGGERLSVAAVERFLHRHPGIALLNGYGPVESTVFATTHRVREADLDRPDGIPLGRPVAGTRVHVLDGSRPCGAGETGEICIAGEGLALRYLNDPALTAARFVELPLEGGPCRLYRTGDLGTWSDDGLLLFRGRADRQVKIRGHRVEPAEVERQIERLLPDVRSCRVVARPDGAGQALELVAFCVPRDPGESLADAPAVLRSALVSYQQPAAVVRVKAFPRTAQGKLDERALLAMAPRAAPDAGEAHRRPQETDVMVELVAQAFASVLGRAHVPGDLGFFDLGGTSLEAGRVCARLGARWGRPVPLAWLYDNASAAALAGRLLAAGSPAAVPRDPAATSLGDEAEAPLTPMQLVFLLRQLADPSNRTGHCLLVWTLEGEIDGAALEGALRAVHQRHPALRAAYVADPRPAAYLVDVPPPALEVLPGQPSVDAALQALRADLAAPLELGDGEVWRTVLVPVGGGGLALLGCVVHHIAFDGWSESVLAHDLAAAYSACRGSGHALAGPIAPAHEAHAPGSDLLAADAKAELRRELSSVPALSWPEGSTRTGGGEPGWIELPLAPSVISGAEALAAGAGVTRFVFLLHHFAKALAALTGQRDFCLGFPVRQRDRADLERVVGCHIDMLCVRLRGPALDDGAAALRETGRVVRQAFARDLPFTELLSLVNPPRSERPPLFQALFALQDNPTPHLDLHGLQTTFLRQPYLDLPLELHAELWPEAGGGLRLGVYFRRQAVPEAAARDLANRVRDGLQAATEGIRS